MKKILTKSLVSTALVNLLLVTQMYAQSIDVRVTNGMDDIEEHSTNGRISSGSSDLEMTLERDKQLIAIRFPGIQIPQGATISNAYIQFQTDEVSTETTNLNITVEDSANAPAFTKDRYYITNLPTISESIQWQPAPWTSIGEASDAQKTEDLTTLVQTIVDKSTWQEGNAIAFIISGDGKRVAESSNGDRTGAPLLHVEFTTEDTQPPISATDIITAEYRFDSCSFDGSEGDVKDTTGNFNATSKNIADTVKAKLNNGVALHGENDYIELPAMESTFDKGITISAWIAFEDISNDNTKYEHIVDLSNGLCDDSTDGKWCAKDYISLWRDGANNTLRFQIRENHEDAGSHPHITIPDTNMHHYAATFDYKSGKAKIYIDGTLQDTQDWNSSIFDPEASRNYNYIGKTIWDARDGNFSSAEYPTDATIDEVKLFNGALTDTQIQEIYNNENSGKNYDGTQRETLDCTDEVTLPTISVSDQNCTEGESGTTPCTFTITLSNAYTDDITLQYETIDDSATAGEDYTSVSGTLTIPAGSTEATVTVNITGDTTVEDNETFTLTLSNALTGAESTLPDPLAWYTFDTENWDNAEEKTVIDSIGNYNGTIIGDSVSLSSGKEGNGALFNGGYATFGDVLNPGATDQWTISGWFNWDGDNSTNQILGKDHVYQIIVDNGQLRYALSPHWSFDGADSFPVTPNEWTHFTLTYDGVNQKLYKNGQLVYTRAQSGDIGSSTQNFTIGAFHNGNFAFHGIIDDVRMFDKALTANQISTMVNTNTQGEQQSLQFTNDSATGTILNDDQEQQVQNHRPSAENIEVTVDQNSSIEITLNGSDDDNDTLNYFITSQPQHGELNTTNLPVVIYTPQNDYNGTDTFTYVTGDGEANSTKAIVTITVNKVEEQNQQTVVEINEDNTSNTGCAGEMIRVEATKTTVINGSLSNVWEADRYSFLAMGNQKIKISVKDENNNAVEYYVIRNCYEQIEGSGEEYQLPENCGLVTIMVVGCQNSDGSSKQYKITVEYIQ
jgi:hypothetical protein